MSGYLVLSPTDKVILESYKILVDGLSAYLGEGYEIILHSLEDLDHSVIKIINGHYTERCEGAPITDLALTMLEDLNRRSSLEVKAYFNHKSGKTLKSVTIPVVGEQRRIIGLLCINFHMEISVFNFLTQFLPNEASNISSSETFNKNADGLLISALEDAKAQIYGDKSVNASNKNKEIIRLLYQRGIFNIKDAVASVAGDLGISKNTVYLHLRNIQTV